MDLKVNLENILAFHGTNLNQVAEAIDESHETLRRFRNNTGVRYSKTMIEKICTHFALNIDDLINDKDHLKTTFEPVVLEKNETLVLYCNLRTILKDRNLTIQSTATAINEHFESLRRLINNITERIPIDLIEKLLTFLQLHIHELFSLKKVKVNHINVNQSESNSRPNVKITTNLKALLNEREVTLKKVSDDTGLSYQMLLRFQHDQMKRYPLEMLETLCSYFHVPLSKLLLTEIYKS